MGGCLPQGLGGLHTPDARCGCVSIQLPDTGAGAGEQYQFGHAVLFHEHRPDGHLLRHHLHDDGLRQIKALPGPAGSDIRDSGLVCRLWIVHVPRDSFYWHQFGSSIFDAG